MTALFARIVQSFDIECDACNVIDGVRGKDGSIGNAQHAAEALHAHNLTAEHITNVRRIRAFHMVNKARGRE